MKPDLNKALILGKVQKIWNDQPLILILGSAILFRLLAAIFAKGWGMLDDHYLVIESSQSWVDGYDYNLWLPWSKGNTGPTGHNFFYPGVHFLLFSAMKWLDITDPQIKMLIIRTLLGLFSMITVYYGYRIVEVTEDKKSARLAGILLALYFFMPWISVRNLAESSCIPFVILGFWQIVKRQNNSRPFRTFFIAGILFGLACDVRFQLIFFPLGVFIILVTRLKLRETAGITAGAICSFLLVQILIDCFLWGYPFAEILGYIHVNVTDRNSYFNLPWYNYILTVGGILLPPVSLFFIYGFVRGWKRYFLIFFPAFLFFLFHSFFPNKQERFILPFIPFFIMIGAMSYYKYVAVSGFWNKHKKLLRACWVFFWVINCILLTGMTFTYSKRAKVESMYYLSKYPYLKMIIVEDEKGDVPIVPLFYTRRWPKYPVKREQDSSIYQRLPSIAADPKFDHPQFFIFTGSKNLQARVTLARKSFPLIVYETTIEAGFLDKLMHRLNPVNKADKIFIYRNREFYKTKIR